MNKIPPILEIGGILISSEIITECFCCDYEKCKGICCVDGSDGAPVTMDEIAGIEDALDTVWPMLAASAQSVASVQVFGRAAGPSPRRASPPRRIWRQWL